MKTHFLNLVLYAVGVSAFFSLLLRDGLRERLRFGLRLAGAMVGIAVAVGWIMYFIG